MNRNDARAHLLHIDSSEVLILQTPILFWVSEYSSRSFYNILFTAQTALPKLRVCLCKMKWDAEAAVVCVKIISLYLNKRTGKEALQSVRVTACVLRTKASAC